MNKIFFVIVFSVVLILIGFLIGRISKSSHKNITKSENQKIKTSPHQQYTCAMHPQIRQDEPGLCPICEMDLVPVGSNSSDDPLVLQMTLEAVRLANIQTSIVGVSQASTDSIMLTGKIKEDERQAASLVAHIPGRIEELFITFTGESVSRGQRLATIYSPPLVTAQRELLQAVEFGGPESSIAEAARKKMENWKIPRETILEIEQSKEIKELFAVYAEKSGYVKQRRVSVGDYIKTGDILFDVVNLNRLWVLFDAYEKDLPHIRINNPIKFTVPALPGQSFHSVVRFIDPVVNPSTRVASIRAELSNPGGILKPEMFVRGVLKTGGQSTAEIAVPKSAVMWTGPRSVVYVKIPDMEIPSFQYRDVELGISLGNTYIVREGLMPGEEVVTYGNFAIDAAAQLNNQQSMMNKLVSLKEDAMAGIPNFVDQTPEVFHLQLNKLGNKYIELKDALVATNPEDAKTKVEPFLTALNQMDMTLLEGDAHMFWMEQASAIKSHAEKITEAEDVEEQRRQFGFLSTAMIQSIQAFGAKGSVYFVQYCPMAFDNEGADWLSLEENIRNPYFGDKMMKCGSVTNRLSLADDN